MKGAVQAIEKNDFEIKTIPKCMVNSIKALAGLYVSLDGINEVVLLPVGYKFEMWYN